MRYKPENVDRILAEMERNRPSSKAKYAFRLYKPLCRRMEFIESEIENAIKNSQHDYARMLVEQMTEITQLKLI